MARKPDYRKKDFIAKVSTTLFATRGYQNTTIEQIARESGYAVGTIYLYFDSKEEVLSTILTDFVEAFVDNKMPSINKIEDPVERFRLIIRMFLEATEENPERAWVLATELRKVIRADSVIYRGEMQKLFSIITAALKDLQKVGLIHNDIDLNHHTLMIHGTIETLGLYWNSEREKFPLIDKYVDIADMVLFGLGTDKLRG